MISWKKAEEIVISARHEQARNEKVIRIARSFYTYMKEIFENESYETDIKDVEAVMDIDKWNDEEAMEFFWHRDTICRDNIIEWCKRTSA